MDQILVDLMDYSKWMDHLSDIGEVPSNTLNPLVSEEHVILRSIDGRYVERSAQVDMDLPELLQHFMLHSFRDLSLRLSTGTGLANKPNTWFLN